jgi:hypothetical protein
VRTTELTLSKTSRETQTASVRIWLSTAPAPGATAAPGAPATPGDVVSVGFSDTLAQLARGACSGMVGKNGLCSCRRREFCSCELCLLPALRAVILTAGTPFCTSYRNASGGFIHCAYGLRPLLYSVRLSPLVTCCNYCCGTGEGF